MGWYHPELNPAWCELDMAQKWEVSGDYLVEIWFRIEKDDSGYPKTKEWEQLLARPLSEGVDYFQIASIPFYLKNISLLQRHCPDENGRKGL